MENKASTKMGLNKNTLFSPVRSMKSKKQFLNPSFMSPPLKSKCIFSVPKKVVGRGLHFVTPVKKRERLLRRATKRGEVKQGVLSSSAPGGSVTPIKRTSSRTDSTSSKKLAAVSSRFDPSQFEGENKSKKSKSTDLNQTPSKKRRTMASTTTDLNSITSVQEEKTSAPAPTILGLLKLKSRPVNSKSNKMKSETDDITAAMESLTLQEQIKTSKKIDLKSLELYVAHKYERQGMNVPKRWNIGIWKEYLIEEGYFNIDDSFAIKDDCDIMIDENFPINNLYDFDCYYAEKK